MTDAPIEHRWPQGTVHAGRAGPSEPSPPQPRLRALAWRVSAAKALLGVLLVAVAAPAFADTRATLSRRTLGVGDTVTLIVSTDQLAGSVDWAPLARDFRMSRSTESRRMVAGAGVPASVETVYSVDLVPLQAGVLEIPSLVVGRARTTPLQLVVAPAPTASSSTMVAAAQGAGAGDTLATAARAAAGLLGVAPQVPGAFLETELASGTAYVQQPVGVTLRLYVLPGVNGVSLELPTPDDASLSMVTEGESSREVNGLRYTVVERRYALIPERSGTITLPAPRFHGFTSGGWTQSPVDATGSAKTLQVRPLPDNAPQPFLPLSSLTLRYTSTPARLRAGEAAAVVVQAVARGAVEAGFPELPTPVAEGVQVFAEAATTKAGFSNGQPDVTVTRRYSLVPTRAGHIRLQGMEMPWWDTASATPRVARAPDLELDVAAGDGRLAAPATGADGQAVPGPAGTPGPLQAALSPGAHLGTVFSQASGRLWMGLAIVFGALWLTTLAWAWRLRSTLPAARDDAIAAGTAPATVRPRGGDLKRALEGGSLEAIVALLAAMAPRPADGVDGVIAQLADARQRAALLDMQRARWAGGDVVAARAALRAAFAAGPQWQGMDVRDDDTLPPLYPPR